MTRDMFGRYINQNGLVMHRWAIYTNPNDNRVFCYIQASSNKEALKCAKNIFISLKRDAYAYFCNPLHDPVRPPDDIIKLNGLCSMCGGIGHFYNNPDKSCGKCAGTGKA